LPREVDPGVRVLTLDTGRLPEETYQVIEAVRAGMGLEVEVVTPDPADVAAMVARHGPNLFHKAPGPRRAPRPRPKPVPQGPGPAPAVLPPPQGRAPRPGPVRGRGLGDRAAPRGRGAVTLRHHQGPA